MSKGKLILLLMVVIVVAISITFLVFYLKRFERNQLSGADKAKAVADILGRKPVTVEKVASTNWLEMKGAYLRFAYPEAGKEYSYTKENRPADSGVLESYEYDLENPRQNLSVQVLTANGSANLDEFSGVVFRRLNKDLFTEGPCRAGSMSGVGFVKNENNNFERTCFVWKDQKVFVFVTTGNFKPTVEQTFNHLLSSVGIY